MLSHTGRYSIAFPTITYTFSNGSTSDATQVDQNFSDLINGITDTTKDISVNAITAAGVTTLSGAVTLGASTSNAITINGAISASINLAANTTYNLGATTKGLLAAYLGGGGALTTALKGGTLSGSNYTFTLPAGPGTIGQSLVNSDGNSASVWRYPDKTLTAVTATTYTATGDECIIPIDATSNNVAITMPLTTTLPYKQYTFIRKDTVYANTATITPNGADSIDYGSAGASITLSFNGQSITLVSDGVSNWYVRNHRNTGPWVSYTPATYSVGFGTVANAAIFYRRIGDTLHVMGNFKTGTTVNSTGFFTLPNALVFDTTKTSTNTQTQAAGIWNNIVTAASKTDIMSGGASGVMYIDTTQTGRIYLARATQSNIFVGDGVSAYATTGDWLSFSFQIPISGWIN